MKVKIITKSKNIKIKLSKKVLSISELNRIISTQPKGILLPEKFTRDVLTYNYKHLYPLNKILNKKLEKKYLHDLLLIILDTLRIIKNYKLHYHLIIVDENLVFSNVDLSEIYFIYLPIKNHGDNQNIKNLLYNILGNLKIKTDKENVLINKICNYIDTNFNIDDIKELIKKEFITEIDYNFKNNLNNTQILIDEKYTTVLHPSLNPVLVLLRDINSEEIVIRGDSYIMGKDSRKVNYCIDDNPTISREHAIIKLEVDRYYLQDLSSKNGTYLNGLRLQKNEKRELHLYDKLRLSNEDFIVIRC